MVQRAHAVNTSVDLGILAFSARHAEQGIDFRQELGERSAAAQHGEKSRRSLFQQRPGELVPDAFRRQRRKLTPGDDRPHDRLGFRRDGEAEASSEARDAQHAQRILRERRADVAQYARTQILRAAERIDQGSVVGTRHRIDREVASREIFLEGDAWRSVKAEAPMSAPGLALGAGERVFLVRLGVQEYRKVAADRTKPAREQFFRRGSDDDVVAIGERPSQQLITHRAADPIDLHAGHAVRRVIVR